MGRYNNVAGNLSLLEFVTMHHKGELENYKRGMFASHVPRHKIQCPPEALLDRLPGTVQCFYCIDCLTECEKMIKEYKHHYRVAGETFQKTDLDNID